jgi:hypothetical protein
MDDREVDEGDWRGVSLGEPSVVEGADDSYAMEEAALRRAVRLGRAVEAIAVMVKVNSWEEGIVGLLGGG